LLWDILQGGEDLLAFIDSDYAGDEEDSKSTSNYVFLLSSRVVSWMSKKQPVVALSTTEVEFIVVAAACVRQSMWMRKVSRNLNLAQEGSMIIMCVNNSTIKTLKKSSHAWKKHTY